MEFNKVSRKANFYERKRYAKLFGVAIMEKDTEEWLKNFATLKDLKLFIDEKYPYCSTLEDIDPAAKLLTQLAPTGNHSSHPHPHAPTHPAQSIKKLKKHRWFLFFRRNYYQLRRNKK